jgi:hypothetical protein
VSLKLFHSQNKTIAGGGSPIIPAAIAPNTIGNLLAWYDASNSANVTHSGGLVTQLNDISGNGRHLTSSGSLRPTFVGSGGAMGNSYIQFASGKVLDLASISVAQPFTVVMYWRPPATVSNGDHVLRFSADVVGLYFVTITYPGLPEWGCLNLYGGALAVWNLKNQYKPNQWNLVKMVNGNSASDYDLSINLESRQPKTSSSIGSFTMDRIRLGNSALDFHEMVVYSGRVTEDDLDGLSGYFYNKYSFNIGTSLIAFGDSITQGVVSGTVNSSPYIFQAQQALGIPIYNHAILGTRVRAIGGANSLEVMYTKAFRYRQPDTRLHFQYGTNDCADDSTSAANITAWKAAYKAVLQDCIDEGFEPSKMYLCTPPNSTFASIIRGNLVRTVDTIRDIATEMNLVLVDFYAATLAAGLDCNDTPDRIHPDDDICDVLSDTFINEF